MAKSGIKLGFWAFLIGLILAVIISIFSAASTPSWAIWVLAILGLIVGLFNVTGKEVQIFLIAAVAFVVSFQSLSVVYLGWAVVSTFFSLMSAFIAPAAAIVAIIALFKIAKD